MILDSKSFVDKIRLEEALAIKNGGKLYKNSSEIKEIIEAQYVVKSAIHPDTQKINPVPMRVCSFLFTNIPIVLAMLLAKPTITATITVQFVNQSVNAALNYGNRNASNESSSNTIIESLFSRMDTSYSFLKNYIFLISPKSCKDESKASCNEAGVTILMVPW